MSSLTWIRMAPLLAVLLIAAGLLSYFVPAAKIPSIIALCLFGIAMLYAWYLTVRAAEEQHLKIKALETRKAQLKTEVDRHREALDDLADGLDAAVFLTDQDQNVLYANRQASSLFSNPDPTNQTLLAVTLSNDLSDLAEKTSQTKEPQHAELSIRLPQEKIVIASAWLESSREARMFISLTDITSLRRLERVRRDFVANVSHELRTPMTTIRAMTETVQDDLPQNHEANPYLNKVIKEVDRLTHIVNDLLTLSVAESAAPKKEPCDFAEITRSIVHQLQPKATQKGLDITLHSPEKLEISAHPTQLSQVVLNLTDNAINYTTEGKVTITLEKTEANQAQLTVTDTGIGISSEHLPRIFERFYRVDKGRSRATGGTGLGLAIIRHITQAHGGTIKVTSELNKGTTFTATFPI